MAEFIVRAKNLVKKFATKEVITTALSEVTIEISVGEIVAVCGPSGAGKSTLLHLLGLMDSPSSGSIELLGKNIENLNEKEKANIRNKYIGFLFQFHYLLPEFTVRENILIPLLMNPGKNNRKNYFHIDELLSKLNIDKLQNRFPAELAGGEQQRVALARAIINNPKIILADEPTGNLDQANGEIVRQILWSYAEKNDAGIIIATHNIGLAQKAHRVINLKDGRII